MIFVIKQVIPSTITVYLDDKVNKQHLSQNYFNSIKIIFNFFL